MQVTIQADPAYSVAYCSLDAGEKIRSMSGAMATMSAGVDVSVDAGPGGVVKGLMRKSLAKESFFMTTYTARVQGAWVALAPEMPGDVCAVNMSQEQEGLYVQGSSVLGMTAGLSDNVRFAGLGSVALHEGAVLQRVHGDGQLLVSTYGGLQSNTLGNGETMIVDTGHLVALSDGMQKTMRVGPLAGLLRAKFSGEGLVAELQGPGLVLTQTRTEAGVQSWLMPDRTNK